MQVQAPSAFKTALLERVRPLDFGRKVVDNPAEQEEIEALIRQVEAENKSTNPSADPNLSGDWQTIYTSSASILEVDRPSFLRSYKISQIIDARTLSAKNESVVKVGPFDFHYAVEAKLVPQSDSKFEVNFVKFIINNWFTVDVENNDRFKGSLEITYLDEDLRIARGNKGNVFVLTK